MASSHASGNSQGSTQVANLTLPHDEYGPQLNATIWSLSALALGWLGIRVYFKLYRHRRLWWDDYVLVASWVALLGGTIAVTMAVHFGFGKHNYDIKPHNFRPLLFVSSFAGFFFIVGAAWSKTSFAITMLRISEGWWRVAIWFIIVSVNVVLGLSALFTWIRCWPLEKNWTSSVEGTCWPIRITLTYNMFTAVMDIVLALIPWKVLWSVTMNKKEKLGALCGMSMGVFAGITSLVKIYTIQYSGNADMRTAEIAVTIMAACIPILRALARDKSTELEEVLESEDTASRWTWQRISEARSVPSPSPVLIAPKTDIFDDLVIIEDDDDDHFDVKDEIPPVTKKRWTQDKTQIQPLPKILEADENAQPKESFEGFPKEAFEYIQRNRL